jgi:hypothetical protein
VWSASFAPGALTHSLEAAPESDRLVVGPLDGRTLSLRSNLASQDDESPSGLAAHPRQFPMPAVRLNRSGRNCMVVMPLLCCAASSSEGDMAIVQTRATRTSARLRRAAPVAIAVALLWVPVYLALYTFPHAYTSVSLPGSALLNRLARRLWSVPTYALANALGMRDDISREVAFYERRNIGVLVNDTPVAVLRGVVLALVSLVAAGAWVVADPDGSRTRSLHRALRLYLRYTLAFILLGYGFARVFDQQFAFFPLAAVVSPLGDLEPQSLLWTMMGFSRPYAAFVGVMEVAAAILLLFRRTTTLGALLASGVLANVTLLNFTFGVWVKLFALHLLAIALTLAALDLKRLADVLLWNRSTEARP